MGSQLALKSRIRSTESLAKIFNAQEMIASSHIAKARDVALNAKPYTDAIFDAVQALVAHTHIDHPIVKKDEDNPRVAVLALTSDRGMAGAYTSSIIRETESLLARLDELVRLVDDLPTLNAVAQAATMRRPGSADAPAPAAAAPAEPPPWWQPALQRAWEALRDEARGLLRISRIDQPDALLLAPDQAFFLRENLKLKLLNARLAVLARQTEAARSDLGNATAALNKYFDPASRRTQNAATLLQQIQAHMKNNEAPRLDDTLAALATAAAGR